MSDFLATEHPLADFKEQIDRFRGVDQEIASLDDVVSFEMFQLECLDIKRGLSSLAQGFVSRLVRRLADDHIKENQRYVN